MPTKSLADASKNGIPGLNDNYEQSQNTTKQLENISP